MSQKTILSICIPTYKRPRLLKQLLSSIAFALRELESGQVDVHVRRNGPDDEAEKVLRCFEGSMLLFSHENSTNVGPVQAIFNAAKDATGEYLWLIGDDDIIHSDGILRVIHALLVCKERKLPACVINHEIVQNTYRDYIISNFHKKPKVEQSRPLFDPKLGAFILDSYEQLHNYTTIPLAMNFFSNMVIETSLWHQYAVTVEQDTIGEAPFSKQETTFPHTCVWIDALVGRPLYFMSEPVMFGFVGEQDVISRWNSITMGPGLDLALRMKRNGADPECVQLYARRIYNDANLWKKILLSTDEYTRSVFSLKDFFRNYGNDNFVWKVLSKTMRSISGRKTKAKIIFTIILKSSGANGAKKYLMKFIVKELEVFATTQKNRFLNKVKKKGGYQQKINEHDSEATAYFRSKVVGCGKAVVRHPVYLVKPEFIKIGDDFYAGPGLRVEAWDYYLGVQYKPVIRIGDRVTFNHNCHVGAINLISIGNDIIIGSNVLITDHQHGNLKNPERGVPWRRQKLWSKGPVVIGDNVWIGENVSVMPGVSIGRDSVIGANSVVTRDIPPFSIAAGSPAKVLRIMEETAESGA